MKNKTWQFLKSRKSRFKHRKIVHYSLLAGAILLQFFLFLVIYNEFYNEPKLQKLQSEIHISEKAKYFSDLTKDDLISAQNNLHNYIHTNDYNYLVNYNSSLKSLIKNLQNFVIVSKNSELFQLYLTKYSDKEFSINTINAKIDSINTQDLKLQKFSNNKNFKLETFKYQDVLDSISFETTVSIDSVKRKGLLSRVGNAITGKVDIQKEKSNVVLTLRKGKNVTTGSIEEQLDFLIKTVNDHYLKQFNTFKANLIKENKFKNESNSNFYKKNKELINYSTNLLISYNKILNNFTDQTREDFQKQYDNNKKIRNLSIIAVIVLVIVISIILVFVTQMTFSYEKRLIKARRKISQNLKFKDLIMRMISHEIRSPLNIISIYSRSIRKQIDNNEVEETLKSIEFTTQNLSLLANQILEFSKNEHNKLVLNKSKFNLKYQLEEVLKSLISFTESKGNTLVVNTNLHDDIMVDTDVVKIHQLLYNLVGNSNKFTSNGLIEVNVDYQKYDENKESLTVQIKDNGVGITEEELQHVFENHYQGSNSVKIDTIGAGLGLNLCKEIVELFSGNISISSTKNVETIVSFKLYL